MHIAKLTDFLQAKNCPICITITNASKSLSNESIVLFIRLLRKHSFSPFRYAYLSRTLRSHNICICQLIYFLYTIQPYLKRCAFACPCTFLDTFTRNMKPCSCIHLFDENNSTSNFVYDSHNFYEQHKAEITFEFSEHAHKFSLYLFALMPYIIHQHWPIRLNMDQMFKNKRKMLQINK